MFRKKKIILEIIFILISNIIILSLPLTSVLAYEFAFFNSILLYFIIGFYTINALKKSSSYSEIFLAILIFTALPLTIGIVNTVIVKGCSINDGLLFYIALTIISALFSLSVAHFIFSFFKKYKISIFITVSLLLLIFSFINYYQSPQLFLLNPIFGYFSGFIFDELIELSFKVIYYRIIVLLFSIILFLLALKIRSLNEIKLTKKFKVSMTLFLLIIISIFYYFSDDLGFSVSSGSLKAKFNSKIIGKGFSIYFNSASNEPERINIKKKLVEFHLADLKDKMKIYKNHQIDIFFFDDENQKKEILGTSSADFTKPWLNMIFINKKSFFSNIRHELVHILAKEFSDNIFGVSAKVNLSLIEGLAVAMDFIYMDHTPHEFISSYQKYFGEIKIKDIFNNYSFAYNNTNLSYNLSGSICKYLIDTYGIELFKDLYRCGNLEKTYGFDFDSLRTAYMIFIKNKTPYLDSLSISYLFRRESVLQKRCVRSIAYDLKKAEKYERSKDYTSAEKIYEELWEYYRTPEIAKKITGVLFAQKKYKKILSFYYTNNQFNYDIKFLRAYLDIINSEILLSGYLDNSLLNLIKEFKVIKQYNRYILLIQRYYLDSKLFSIISGVNNNKDYIKSVLKEFNKDKEFYLLFYNYLDNQEKETLIKEINELESQIIFNLFEDLLLNKEFDSLDIMIKNLKMNDKNYLKNNLTGILNYIKNN